MLIWATQHLGALRLALRRLGQAPLNTALSLLAISVALALPAGGEVLLRMGTQVASKLNATPEISLFLALDADRKAIDEIAQRLKNSGSLKEFHFVPRAETLKRFAARSNYAEVIAALPGNPFPDAYVAVPRGDMSADALDKLRAEFARWPRVEHVQLDSAWAQRLDALLHLGRVLVGLLAVLLGLGLVAITFTTIRLQVLTQRTEIEVSRLLGATDAFVSRPFYYFGTLLGLLGGCGAWLIVACIALVLREPMSELADLYAAGAGVQTLGLGESAALLGLAAGLGWMGTALSLRRYLREALA